MGVFGMGSTSPSCPSTCLEHEDVELCISTNGLTTDLALSPAIEIFTQLNEDVKLDALFDQACGFVITVTITCDFEILLEGGLVSSVTFNKDCSVGASAFLTFCPLPAPSFIRT